MKIDDESRQWLKKNDSINGCKKKAGILNIKTCHFQCALIWEVCASDLLLRTQGHPHSQCSLNYNRVPMQKEQSSRYQAGNTYSNWLDYFSHGSATTQLFQHGDYWYGITIIPPMSVCLHVFMGTNSTWKPSISNNHCLVFVREPKRQTDRQWGIESVTDIQTTILVLSLTPEVLKITPTRKDTSASAETLSLLF